MVWPSRLVLVKKFFWIWFIYTPEGCVLVLQFFSLTKCHFWNTLLSIPTQLPKPRYPCQLWQELFTDPHHHRHCFLLHFHTDQHHCHSVPKVALDCNNTSNAMQGSSQQTNIWCIGTSKNNTITLHCPLKIYEGIVERCLKLFECCNTSTAKSTKNQCNNHHMLGVPTSLDVLVLDD